MPVNPFGQDDPLAPGGGSGAWGAGAGAGAGAGGFGQQTSREQAYAVDGDQYEVVDIAEPGASAPVAASPATKGKANNARNLASWEADLKRRENDIKKREAAVARSGGAPVNTLAVKNFPACMPMVHHDIPNDIPAHKRNITRAGFFVFLLTCAALLYNAVCVAAAAFAADAVGNQASSILFAIIYVLIGIPGAWVLWYSRLYRAMMTDGAMSFATFFFIFLIHLAFSVWSAVAPDLVSNFTAHAGFFPAVQLMGDSGAGNKVVGIMYFVSAGVWTLLSFVSFTYLVRVYNFFRSSGGEQRLTNEVTASGAHFAANQYRAQNTSQV